MHVEHPYPEISSGVTGTGYRVGNVVELEIKEDIKTLTDQRLHQLWTGTGKQLLANLEAAQFRT
jgi:hypothetical protein